MVDDREAGLLVVLSRAIVVVVASTLASTGPLASQQAISWEAGVISDVGVEGLRTNMQFGARVTSAKDVGFEIALATFPVSIADGWFLLTGDFGAMISVPVGARSEAWWLPHLGVTGLAFETDRGASVLVPGLSLGMGYLKATSPTRGVRFDLTFRRYEYFTPTHVLVLTAGLAWL